MSEITERAKSAYNAYGRSTGYKNYRGEPMPSWAELGDAIQAAWIAAAEALLPPLAPALTVYQAWWEDYPGWDGGDLYLDLDTAKEFAAAAYVSENYADQDDEETARPGELTWARAHGSWHLSDGGKATLVQVSPTTVYRRR